MDEEYGAFNDVVSEMKFDEPAQVEQSLKENESVCFMDSFWLGVLTLKETVHYLESTLKASAESGEVGELKFGSETYHNLVSLLRDVRIAVLELEAEKQSEDIFSFDAVKGYCGFI